MPQEMRLDLAGMELFFDGDHHKKAHIEVVQEISGEYVRNRPVRTAAQATAFASLDCGTQFHGSSSSRRLIL